MEFLQEYLGFVEVGVEVKGLLQQVWSVVRELVEAQGGQLLLVVEFLEFVLQI